MAATAEAGDRLAGTVVAAAADYHADNAADHRGPRLISVTDHHEDYDDDIIKGVMGHAVVFPYPAQGHLNPVMQLARQLALRHRFLVTFVTTAEFHSRMVANGTKPHQQHRRPRSRHVPGIRFAQISDGLPPDFNRFGDNLTALSQALERMHDPFESLIANLMCSPRPATCIFSDMFAPFTQDVADKFHLPRVAIWLQSAASYAVNLHVPLLIEKGHMPIKTKSMTPPVEDMITCIPGHPPLAPAELPSFYQVPDLSDFMVQFKMKPFYRAKEPAFVLLNTFTELEQPMLDVLRRDHPTLMAGGPLLPPAFLEEGGINSTAGSGGDDEDKDDHGRRTGTALWAEDMECLTWLDAQPPSSVLYVSFGSIASMPAPQFMELALGLKASRARVLWVARPDFIQPPFEASPPLSDLLESLQTKSDDTIRLIPWAPQALVLSHPSTGAFLTHCGWNSTLEGISMGVPMLAWPLFAEQWLNRKWIVEEWKVGLKFQEREDGWVSRDEVERVVKEIMEGPQGHEIRERAHGYRDASKKAWKEGGSSFNNLTMVIQSILDSFRTRLTCSAK